MKADLWSQKKNIGLIVIVFVAHHTPSTNHPRINVVGLHGLTYETCYSGGLYIYWVEKNFHLTAEWMCGLYMYHTHQGLISSLHYLCYEGCEWHLS